MKSQKTLQDYIARKTYWRVLKNTLHPDNNKKINEIVGGILEQCCFFDYDQTVTLWNKDKSSSWTFNLSDLQKVYGQPTGEKDEKGNDIVEYLEKDGYAIGVRDTILQYGCDRGYIVFDFYAYDGKVWIDTYSKEDEPLQDTYRFELGEIDKVIPLHSQTLPMTEEAMLEHLKRVGRIKNGEVVV